MRKKLKAALALAAAMAVCMGASASAPTGDRSSDPNFSHSMALAYRVDNGDMFTNVKVEVVDFMKSDADVPAGSVAYALEGMFSWYQQEFVTAHPTVAFTEDGEYLCFPPGQEVIDREGIKWGLYNMATEEEMSDAPVYFKKDELGVYRWQDETRIENPGAAALWNPGAVTSIGFIVGSEGDVPKGETEPEMRMLYILKSPVFHPFNGRMTYDFVAQNGNAYSQKAVIHSRLDGRNWIVRNWSDSGFDFDIFFTVDAEAMTVNATQQTVLDDPDMMGECVLSASDEKGQPIRENDRLVLRGTISNELIDGKEQSVITFPTWGCFDWINRSYYVPTANTKVYPGYDITDLKNSVGEVTVDSNAPIEYYDLQGRRVENPSAGLYIRKQGGRTTKILVH